MLTTNYDDAIERAARERGLEPIPMLATNVRMLDTPAAGQLYVIHLHGLPEQPESLVLPGRTTEALGENEAFITVMRARMAAGRLLYLGFSPAATERHLHAIIDWLRASVPDARDQYLLLAQDEIATRSADIAAIEATGIFTIVPYIRDRAHTAVERVALVLAPRTVDEHEPTDTLTWVQPLLAQIAPGDGWERLHQRAVNFDHRISNADLSTPS